MQLTRNKVAVLNYVLTDDAGDTIDQSHDATFAYLHGAGNIIPGLERALEGGRAGDEFKVAIEAADGYGEQNPENIQRVPRDMFPPDMDIEPGMRFQAQTAGGSMELVTVTAVTGGEIIVDGNHPLAGKRLHFQVSIVSVRDASNEELSHGHVHGPGGHHH